jgi:hypothetical protein
MTIHSRFAALPFSIRTRNDIVGHNQICSFVLVQLLEGELLRAGISAIINWPMSKEQILALLFVERDRLNLAIEALGGTTGKRRGRPPGSRTIAPAKRKRTLSAAGRKAIAEAARKRWAAIRAGKARSPFAKRAKRSTR